MTTTAQQISHTLQHTITQEINKQGGISFARFMEMALYQPGLGYYSAGLKKLGTEGDFVTAPELGSLFAQCHARVFKPILAETKGSVILELGAGLGSFCCDVLTALDELHQLPEAYWILEVSADLKQQQQQAVAKLPPHLSEKVVWLDSLPQQAFSGVIFGNEVLDALPVEVFQQQSDTHKRLMLCEKDGELCETWQDFPEDLSKQLASKQLNLSEDHRSEFIPNLEQWLSGITQHFQSGLVMWVDYGYGAPAFYHPVRKQGTVVCHQRHEANFNPYQSIGLQDITAFVDFTHVAECLATLGFDVQGFTTQGDFLADCGIDTLLNPEGEFKDYFKLASEMKQLMLPTEMGEKFKVLAATKDCEVNLIGFSNNKLYDL